MDAEGHLFLSVLGKGRKRRQLPLNQNMQQVITEYKALFDRSVLQGDGFPLAPRVRRVAGEVASLSARGLRFWWQSFMGYCAEQSENPVFGARLKEIPFHSLRHTALTHLAQKMDIEDLAIFAGHDSINTTSQYYHAEAERLRTFTENHGL